MRSLRFGMNQVYRSRSGLWISNCTTTGVEIHKVVLVTKPRLFASLRRTTVAIFRRRDMAEDLCGELNQPKAA
jgi:hypothetical protein